MQDIQKQIKEICTELFDYDGSVSVERTDEQFGDFACNVALQLSKELSKNPREVAEMIVGKLTETGKYKKVDIAGPGFINITQNDSELIKYISSDIEPTLSLKNKVVVVEYSDPNSFKILHAGHLYTSIVGDAIANLFEVAGAKVHRVNFGGDVGLHVAKSMWAILKEIGGENPARLNEVSSKTRPEWMSQRYVEGNTAYEEDKNAKNEIVEINKRVYRLHEDNDKASDFAQIYWTCREWSYNYFAEFYKQINTKFDKYYPESVTIKTGLETVKKHVPEVFQESQGAIIFDGEKYGLHTRVFINSQGLPTYEAKDTALVMLKWNDYHFDKSVVITGNEQQQYMSVVLKAIEQFEPNLAKNSTHITHGMVKLAGGAKMSSRTGNILKAADVLELARQASKKTTGNNDEKVTLAAVKYAFLKQRTGGDIIYDPNESVSIEGNSGPYLQYAYVRAKSILNKSTKSGGVIKDLTSEERTFVRKMDEYPAIITDSVNEMMPHYICTYIYELAQSFNRFYEKNRIIGDERESQRIEIVSKYEKILKNSFEILNIPIVEKM